MESGKMTHGSLFSGIGGFDLAAKQCEIETLWNCELLKKSRQVLSKIDNALQYDNIKTLEKPQYVDIISGGFPCQDISIAGNGTGIFGDRSSLFFQMLRIIRKVRPKYIIIENSPMLLVRGFEQVLCDLSKIGYDAEWQCLSGTDFGIQQRRERLYCIAYPHSFNIKGSSKETVFRKPYIQGEFRRIYPGWRTRQSICSPKFIGKHNELPYWVDRVKCLGNAVQPIIAHYLFECIKVFDKNQ